MNDELRRIARRGFTQVFLKWREGQWYCVLKSTNGAQTRRGSGEDPASALNAAIHALRELDA